MSRLLASLFAVSLLAGCGGTIFKESATGPVLCNIQNVSWTCIDNYNDGSADLAVSPGHVVLLAGSRLSILNRSNNSASTLELRTLFNGAISGINVVWDPTSGRWFVLSAVTDGTPASWRVAVSKTATPSNNAANWWVYTIPHTNSVPLTSSFAPYYRLATPTYLVYPQMSVTGDKVLLSGWPRSSSYDLPVQEFPSVLVVAKSSLLSGTVPTTEMLPYDTVCAYAGSFGAQSPYCGTRAFVHPNGNHVVNEGFLTSYEGTTNRREVDVTLHRIAGLPGSLTHTTLTKTMFTLARGDTYYDVSPVGRGVIDTTAGIGPTMLGAVRLESDNAPHTKVNTTRMKMKPGSTIKDWYATVDLTNDADPYASVFGLGIAVGADQAVLVQYTVGREYGEALSQYVTVRRPTDPAHTMRAATVIKASTRNAPFVFGSGSAVVVDPIDNQSFVSVGTFTELPTTYPWNLLGSGIWSIWGAYIDPAHQPH